MASRCWGRGYWCYCQPAERAISSLFGNRQSDSLLSAGGFTGTQCSNSGGSAEWDQLWLMSTIFLVAVAMGGISSLMFGLMMFFTRNERRAADYGLQASLFVLTRLTVPIMAGILLDRRVFADAYYTVLRSAGGTDNGSVKPEITFPYGTVHFPVIPASALSSYRARGFNRISVF